MKRLAILGASGHGKVVAEIAELNGWQVSFFDDVWPKTQQIGIWPVIGTTDNLVASTSEYSGAVVAIGNNQIRCDKLKMLQNEKINVITLVHPKAIVSQYAKIGVGTVIMAGAIINPFAKIGMGAIVNTASTIDHDCVLGDCIHISPGANLAGAVIVGALSWIGIGAAVKQCITIGKNVVVGAGAVTVEDVADNTIVKGNPAR